RYRQCCCRGYRYRRYGVARYMDAPAFLPRLMARVARVEPDAPQRLPAALRASLNIAPVSLLLADRRTTVGAKIFHRARLRRRVRIDTTLAVGGGLTIRSTSFATACNTALIIGWYSPGST